MNTRKVALLTVALVVLATVVLMPASPPVTGQEPEPQYEAGAMQFPGEEEVKEPIQITGQIQLSPTKLVRLQPPPATDTTPTKFDRPETAPTPSPTSPPIRISQFESFNLYWQNTVNDPGFDRPLGNPWQVNGFPTLITPGGAFSGQAALLGGYSNGDDWLWNWLKMPVPPRGLIEVRFKIRMEGPPGGRLTVFMWDESFHAAPVAFHFDTNGGFWEGTVGWWLDTYSIGQVDAMESIAIAFHATSQGLEQIFIIDDVQVYIPPGSWRLAKDTGSPSAPELPVFADTGLTQPFVSANNGKQLHLPRGGNQTWIVFQDDRGPRAIVYWHGPHWWPTTGASTTPSPPIVAQGEHKVYLPTIMGGSGEAPAVGFFRPDDKMNYEQYQLRSTEPTGPQTLVPNVYCGIGVYPLDAATNEIARAARLGWMRDELLALVSATWHKQPCVGLPRFPAMRQVLPVTAVLCPNYTIEVQFLEPPLSIWWTTEPAGPGWDILEEEATRQISQEKRHNFQLMGREVGTVVVATEVFAGLVVFSPVLLPAAVAKMGWIAMSQGPVLAPQSAACTLINEPQ